VTAQELMAERYGRSPNDEKRNRRNITIAAIALGVIFLIFAIYSNFLSGPNIEAKTTGYEITSKNQAIVKYQVTQQSQDIICSLKVLNQAFSVVGYREVTIPAMKSANSSQFQNYETKVNTTELGVSGLLDKCFTK
jgi:hypothetical protein